MAEVMRPRRYVVGQVVPFLSQKDVLTVGGHRFVNVDGRRRVSRTQYPWLAKLYDHQGVTQSGFDFKRSEDLPLYVDRSLIATDATAVNYATANGLGASLPPNTIRYVVILGNTAKLAYGDSTGFSIATISPSKVLKSVCYSPTHDKFFFGRQSGGDIYVMDNTNPSAGVSVVGSLPAGFTNDVVAIHATASGTLIACSSTNEVARSTNGGTTWTDVVASTGNVPYEMAEDASGNLVLACASGQARWSGDDGLTWNVVSEAGSYYQTYRAIDCNPDTGVFVIGSDSTIFRLPTYNGTLTQIAGTYTGTHRTVKWVTGTTWISVLYAPTSEIFAFVSTDDGLTWSGDIMRADSGLYIYAAQTNGFALNGTELAWVEDSNAISFSPYPDASGETFDILGYPTGVAGYNNFVCVR